MVKIGDTFGKLKTIERGKGFVYDGRTYPTWICRCECGSICEAHEYGLIKGRIKSCGCLKHEPKQNPGINKNPITAATLTLFEHFVEKGYSIETMSELTYRNKEQVMQVIDMIDRKVVIQDTADAAAEHETLIPHDVVAKAAEISNKNERWIRI